MQSSNYSHYPPFRPTLPPPIWQPWLGPPIRPLAFNLRIAAYLLTLTLAGAVTHSPPPILAADEDVVEKIQSFFFFRYFQLFCLANSIKLSPVMRFFTRCFLSAPAPEAPEHQKSAGPDHQKVLAPEICRTRAPGRWLPPTGASLLLEKSHLWQRCVRHQRVQQTTFSSVLHVCPDYSDCRSALRTTPLSADV